MPHIEFKGMRKIEDVSIEKIKDQGLQMQQALEQMHRVEDLIREGRQEEAIQQLRDTVAVLGTVLNLVVMGLVAHGLDLDGVRERIAPLENLPARVVALEAEPDVDAGEEASQEARIANLEGLVSQLLVDVGGLKANWHG